MVRDALLINNRSVSALEGKQRALQIAPGGFLVPYITLVLASAARKKKVAARENGTKMPSISDIALGGYAVVATGLTLALLVLHAA